MIVPWTIGALLRELRARGPHPAVISFGEFGALTWGSATLAEKALSFARSLREDHVGGGSAVALWAPNSPAWIAAALAILRAGAVLVPIDELADAEQFEAALHSSGARLLVTTTHHVGASGAILRAHNIGTILVDEIERSRQAKSACQRPVSDKAVNAGEKMYQRAGVKLHHRGVPNAPPEGFLLRDKQDEKRIASSANVPETSSVASPSVLPLPQSILRPAPAPLLNPKINAY